MVFGILGYLLGPTFELFLKEAKRYELIVVLAIIMIGLVFWVAHFHRESKNKVKQAGQADSSTVRG